MSAVELERSLYDFLEHLKYNPLVLGPMIVDYSAAKGAIFSLLYSPNSWSELAAGIHGVMTGNVTVALELTAALESGTDPRLNEYLASIQCSDKAPRAFDRRDILPFIDELFNRSNFSDIQSQVFSWCANWKFQAKERYSGNFDVKTRNPILIIGNTYDPVTPLVSARNVSQTFEGSVLLQHDGYGVSFSVAALFALFLVHIRLTKLSIDASSIHP